MPVPFRFDTVLRVREAERDRCRHALAREQQREAAFVTERGRLSAEREAVLEELRLARQHEGLSVDQDLARRQYAEHLATQINETTSALVEVSNNICQRRNELLEADTAVKGLEKLAGRHANDQNRIEQATAERDRDDMWRAA